MQITINHLTRMGYPHICVAGIDEGGVHKRPVLAPRESGGEWQIHRNWLRSKGGPLELGAVVDLGDAQPVPTTPEVEDVVVNSGQAKFVTQIKKDQFLQILDGSAKDSLESIFGPELEGLSSTAAAVPKGEGKASLGMLRLSGAELKIRNESEIRLTFEDSGLGEIMLKVTDLRFWDGYKPKCDRVERVQDKIDDCLISVGLTGDFEVSRYPGPRHWLQVNNIYPRVNPLWARE